MGDDDIYRVETAAEGPSGALPLTAEFLRDSPSGDVFGLTQNAGMGWEASKVGRDQFLVLSTQGGVRADDGTPVALGYHTGHWEVGLLVREAAKELDSLGGLPFAAHVSDPCDGRTQGTDGMFDSLPYRNDAALVLRRLVRSLPRRRGIIGIGTCDKGLPAMLMAVASFRDLAGGIVPGGVTLPPRHGEDAGAVQTLGARFAHGLVTLEDAADLGCRACASPGGGCQFLGTAATSQVVAEALGLTVPHAALAPSGQPVWLDVARRTAQAVHGQWLDGRTLDSVLTPEAIENAMLVHAAFGGSTNLLIHIPAIAHAAGLPRPTVDDWRRVNRAVPRLVDALPNGPRNHPTVRVFLAGGVPEVMLHLRTLGLLNGAARTVLGRTWDDVLDEWETSERRARLRARLEEADGVDPDDVISPPGRAREKGMTSTVCFPGGNLAPGGSVIKSTAIDPRALDADGVYRLTGRARVFAGEPAAIAAIKGTGGDPIEPGDVIVLCGRGPMGSGMEETYQLTSALKFLPFGREVALVTDARFSGVSTGACIGHVGPEALEGGPIGRLVDGDVIRLIIDPQRLEATVDLVGHGGEEWTPDEASRVLAGRPIRDDVAPAPGLPADTALWARLQSVSGGLWGGCVYDSEAIIAALGDR
jgi:putative YjhG/YagF family dehydratase